MAVKQFITDNLAAGGVALVMGVGGWIGHSMIDVGVQGSAIADVKKDVDDHQAQIQKLWQGQGEIKSTINDIKVTVGRIDQKLDDDRVLRADRDRRGR